jgi:hypothetical protein
MTKTDNETAAYTWLLPADPGQSVTEVWGPIRRRWASVADPCPDRLRFAAGRIGGLTWPELVASEKHLTDRPPATDGGAR